MPWRQLLKSIPAIQGTGLTGSKAARVGGVAFCSMVGNAAVHVLRMSHAWKMYAASSGCRLTRTHSTSIIYRLPSGTSSDAIGRGGGAGGETI